MLIAFTICSNNYLAKARVTAESFVSKHPDHQFFIVLVDEKIPEINYEIITGVEIIAVKEIVPYANELAKKYNIIELNTAVKPAIFQYLFKNYKSNYIIFLDPDLLIYDRFTEVEMLFDNEDCNLIVTPHFCSPIDDGKVPSEIHLSTYGLYNLGFLAVKNSPESHKFLDWWHNRLMKYCYIKPEDGMFTDQLWVNYAPVYFKGVHILKYLGYNVANWNLYERPIDRIDDIYYVNQTDKLKFFHFSHYKFNNPYLISSQQNRHHIDDLKYMRAIVDEYQSKLVNSNQDFFATIPCYYQVLYEANIKIISNPGSRYANFIRRVKNKALRMLSDPKLIKE